MGGFHHGMNDPCLLSCCKWLWRGLGADPYAESRLWGAGDVVGGLQPQTDDGSAHKPALRVPKGLECSIPARYVRCVRAGLAGARGTCLKPVPATHAPQSAGQLVVTLTIHHKDTICVPSFPCSLSAERQAQGRRGGVLGREEKQIVTRGSHVGPSDQKLFIAAPYHLFLHCIL